MGMQGKGIASANAVSTDWYGVVCVTGPVKQPEEEVPEVM